MVETEQPSFTTEEFYRFCSEDKFMAVRCKKCGKLILPPAALCPICYSDSLEWVKLTGEGEVITYTIIYVPTIEFQEIIPYGFVVVKLDEGVNFVGIVKNYEKLKVGQRVKVKFEMAEYKYIPGLPRRARIFFEPVET